MQRRLLRRRARVAADQVQAVNGYVELVRIRVFQHQELGHRPVHFEILQTPVAPDAVLFVHHRGTDAQVSQVADDGFRVTRRTPPPAALPGPVEAQLPGSDHAQGRFGQDQPRVQVPDTQGQRSFAVQKVLPALHRQWVKSPSNQQVLHHFPTPGRGGDDERPGCVFRVQPTGDSIRITGRRRVQGMPRSGIGNRVAGIPLQFTPDQFQSRQCADTLANFPGLPERHRRREKGPFGVAAKLLVALPNQLPPRFQPFQGAVHQHDERIRRQVVRERHGRIEEQRQVVLDPGRQLGIGYVPVDRSAGRFAGHVFPESPPETSDIIGIEGKFPRRQDANLRYLVRAELGMRVEEPQILDFVIEKVDAHRAVDPGRIDIDERAPDREVSGVEYLLDVQVALTDESLPKRPHVKPVACLQHQRPAGDEVRRRQPVQQRLGVDDDDFAVTRNQVI